MIQHHGSRFCPWTAPNPAPTPKPTHGSMIAPAAPTPAPTPFPEGIGTAVKVRFVIRLDDFPQEIRFTITDQSGGNVLLQREEGSFDEVEWTEEDFAAILDLIDGESPIDHHGLFWRWSTCDTWHRPRSVRERQRNKICCNEYNSNRHTVCTLRGSK